MGCKTCSASARSSAMTTTSTTQLAPTSCSCNTKPQPAGDGECHPWRISCETQTALVDCLKQMICAAARCFSDQICADGKLDLGHVNAKTLETCLGVALCTGIDCVEDVLCGPAPTPPPPDPNTLQCNFAVEDPIQ
jgi:hypothetical protein